MTPREMLQIWLRAVLADSRTDIEDKVIVTDELERFGVLPIESWQSVDTRLLGDAQVDDLSGTVRDVVERNPIGEALHHWERLHGLKFGGQSTSERN
jgi:hypothetical protein